MPGEEEINSDFEDSIQVDESGTAFEVQKESPIKKVSSKHEVSNKSCPVANVTVFIDRAEVNRNIELTLEAGDVEVLIKGLPSTADSDSLRVSCYGNATIVEVSYQKKAITEEESEEKAALKSQTEAEIDSIKQKIAKLNKHKERCYMRIKVVQNEQQILESYSKCVSSEKQDKVGDVLEKKSIENMLNFLTIYQERSEKFTEELFGLKGKIEDLDKQLDVLNTNLSKLSPGIEKVKYERNVSILLEAHQSGPVKLVMSYVVSNASWCPMYDVRAFNKDSSVQILYFGSIKQNTGEDWDNAKLSLSTAMPSVGGSPPELPVQKLSVDVPRPVPYKSRAFSFRKKKARARNSAMVCRDLDLGGSAPRSLASEGLFGDSDSESEAALPQAEANENITSTNFEIVRPATIKSDDVGHKVSICQLDFKPQFEYNAIPKAVVHAFLKIKVKNESTYALLAGDAKVFLDNNFITKSTLPAVSPMEEFEVSVGVDPSVKVTYKPLKKFQQTTGMISKAMVFVHHQQIDVKNTKTVPVKITVIDQCPMSSNEKIKVTLQDPEMKLPKPGQTSEPTVLTAGNAKLFTSDYKMEWSVEIPASETKTINLRYQVEYPLGTRITGL